MQYFILKFTIFALLLNLNLLLSVTTIQFFIDDPQNHTFSKYIWMAFVYLALYIYYRLLSKRMVMSVELIYTQKANFLALILITLIIFSNKTAEHYSRNIVLIFFILNLLLPVWVYFLKYYFLKLNRFRENILVICDNKGEDEAQNWFAKNNSFGFDIIQTININNISEKQLQKYVKKEISNKKIYAVMVSITEYEADKAFHIANFILHYISRIYILPKISKLPLVNLEFFSSIGHKGMMLYVKNRLLHDGERGIKDIFDKMVAFVLFIFFLPILFILYIVIYLYSNSNPIYTQKRIGKNGKEFNVYKFKTMKPDADEILKTILKNNPDAKAQWESEFKLKNDPRITKIGKFLRKTSLDELPQLFNVLQGKMSLVGPRPIIKNEIDKYGEYFSYFTAVKPGITGLWQVSGRNDISYDERIRLDVWYVRNWSMELDIIILIKTVFVVISKKGSY